MELSSWVPTVVGLLSAYLGRSFFFLPTLSRLFFFKKDASVRVTQGRVSSLAH